MGLLPLPLGKTAGLEVPTTMPGAGSYRATLISLPLMTALIRSLYSLQCSFPLAVIFYLRLLVFSPNYLTLGHHTLWYPLSLTHVVTTQLGSRRSVGCLACSHTADPGRPAGSTDGLPSILLPSTSEPSLRNCHCLKSHSSFSTSDRLSLIKELAIHYYVILYQRFVYTLVLRCTICRHTMYM